MLFKKQFKLQSFLKRSDKITNPSQIPFVISISISLYCA